MTDTTLVIYPTACKVEDRLLQLARNGCAIGYRLTTLPQLIDQLWHDNADRRIVLDDNGERLILLEAIACELEAKAIGPITPGMRSRILGLIRQLKSAALKSEHWREAYRTLDVVGQARLRDFTTLFTSYERRLHERGVADRHDRELAALQLLHRAESNGGRPHCLRGVERLIVAEIYDLSLLQFMIIASLIRLVGDAEVTIQAEPHKVDASRFADLTWNRFVGEESIADLVLPEFVRRGGRSGRLGFVLEHLFTESSPPPPLPDDSIIILEAASPRAEADEVARVVRQRIEADAIPPNRIGIVARDLAPYREHLTSAFERIGVPITFGVGKKLRAETPARIVLELLKLPAGGYARNSLTGLCNESILQLETLRYIRLPLETGYIDRATRPLAECVETRLRETRAAIANEADGKSRQQLERRLEEIEHGRRAWAILLQKIERLEEVQTLSRHLAYLRAILRELGFDPVAGAIDDSAAAAGAALWRILDQLEIASTRVMPDRLISLAEFADIFEEVLNEAELEFGREEELGGVRALPVVEARGLDFDFLAIIGLNEGSFPHLHREDPLVPPASLRHLNQMLRNRLLITMGAAAPDAPGPILRSRADRDSEEPFLFFLALSMPTRTVALSRCLENAEGQATTPSSFLQEVKRLLQIESGSSLHGSAIDWTGEREAMNRIAATGRLVEDAALVGLNPARAAEISRRIAIERHRGDYLRHPSREELFDSRRGPKMVWASPEWLTSDREKAAIAGPCDGRVPPSAALNDFLISGSGAGPRYWSASQLNDLASCGFKFFAHRILELTDQAAADNELDPLERGTFTHEILQDFFTRVADFNDRERVFATLREVLERWRVISRGRTRDPIFFELEWSTIEASLWEVVEYELVRYGEKDSRPDSFFQEYPLDFQLNGRLSETPVRIPIRGSIDRLELFRNAIGQIERMRVIDYKTSRGIDRYNQLLRPCNFATTDMQSGIYALGAITRWDDQLAPSPKIEASYVALRHRDKETSALVIPPERLLEGPSADGAYSISKRIFELIEQARSGHFEMDPLECSDFCPYRSVCRFEKSKS